MSEEIIESNLKQKALNNAFYATFIQVGLNILFLFLQYGRINGSLVFYIEFIAYPALGYLIKQHSKKAAIALLFLFILDKILVLINWLPYLFQTSSSSAVFILKMIINLLVIFAFWSTYYKAYLYLKKDK